jgi:uncharacterized protein (UPF0335 family)
MIYTYNPHNNMSQPQAMPQAQSQQYPLPVQEVKQNGGEKPTPQLMKQPANTANTANTATPSLELVPSNNPSESSPSITKEQLKDYLRQWVRVENEIGTLSAEIKKRKLVHQQLSKSLLDVMRKNEIDCFDVANGRIVYSKTKTRAPLNNGQIKAALKNYYKDDAEKANSLTEFLLSSRVEKTREAIKMKIPKIK